ncbi:hypothetical protein J6590_062585 [Homalodisca vitripennis]|nr:hypothetical protein J6590_062585 [Homalodisca vitripennis]
MSIFVIYSPTCSRGLYSLAAAQPTVAASPPLVGLQHAHPVTLPSSSPIFIDIDKKGLARDCLFSSPHVAPAMTACGLVSATQSCYHVRREGLLWPRPLTVKEDRGMDFLAFRLQNTLVLRETHVLTYPLTIIPRDKAIGLHQYRTSTLPLVMYRYWISIGIPKCNWPWF